MARQASRPVKRFAARGFPMTRRSSGASWPWVMHDDSRAHGALLQHQYPASSSAFSASARPIAINSFARQNS
jgi:hypothetical protein